MKLIDADKLMENKFKNDISYNAFCNLVKRQPSIDAVKHGRWISCSSSEHYKCSCCGTRASFWFDEENSSGWQMDMSEWLSDYCPHCGARMWERA